nr:GGDEF domain-containing protein [Lachnospiraceae bacterium]
LKKAYDEGIRDNKVFSLLMIDIDDFKRINDTYGHDCGDEVLKFVASTISSCVRKDDKVFRWGGEEILVLTGAEEEAAVLEAERIRTEIEKQTINYRGETEISVTVTIGVTAFDNKLDLKSMMDDVDRKLYHGKQNGKNQVVSLKK